MYKGHLHVFGHGTLGKIVFSSCMMDFIICFCFCNDVLAFICLFFVSAINALGFGAGDFNPFIIIKSFSPLSSMHLRGKTLYEDL